MLEKILKLYTMSMALDIRSPLPHLIGPPGCGKSMVMKQAAESIGCKLHTLNVSRISPLEIEGVQMPHTEDEQAMKLKLLLATFWNDLEEGDILFLDEFLRGFPEVYNGLLDILTSREVGGHVLPKVFIIAASNSSTAYDKALADRLLHLPVADPRKSKRLRNQMGRLIVNTLGLLPELAMSTEMEDLLQNEVCPMFNVLDQFANGSNTPIGGGTPDGRSIRKLIGEAQLREVQSTHLATLISWNNMQAMSKQKYQYVLLTDGKNVPAGYLDQARKMVGNPKLQPIQAMNLALNLQLIELEDIRKEKEGNDGDIDPDDIFS